MNAKWFLIIVAIVLELCSFVSIGHLWARRSHVPLLRRFFWTVLLLVPIAGPFIYIFLADWPDPHDTSYTDGTSGWY
jgi:hypothetical protein